MAGARQIRLAMARKDVGPNFALEQIEDEVLRNVLYNISKRLDEATFFESQGKRMKSGLLTVPAFGASTVKLVAGVNFGLQNDDGIQIVSFNTGSAICALSLPLASQNSGRVIRVVKTDSGTGSVSLIGTINGSVLNNSILKQYGTCSFYSNGVAWLWDQDITEVGSWTPVIATSSVGFTTAVHYVQSGGYTRVGRAVSFGFYVGTTSTTGAPTGKLMINGFPFPMRLAPPTYHTLPIGEYHNIDINGASVQHPLGIEIPAGSSGGPIISSGDNLAAAGINAALYIGVVLRYFLTCGSYSID